MFQDFRFALRQLIKAPGFTFAAVLVLGLGIGANTAVFSLVYAMLFAPPAYARPNELVQVYSQDTKNPKHFRAFSYPTLNDLRDQTSVFAGVAAHNVALVGIGEKGNTRRTFADIVTANYFEVLGVTPVIGRGFTLEEETPGHAATVAVVSNAYWGRHNYDRALLGSELKINGRSYTIVGVLPEKFAGTLSVVAPEVWLPLSAFPFVMNDYSDRGAAEQNNLMSRSGEHLMPIARFKPGVTGQAAEPALKTLAHNLEQAYPVEQKDQTFITRPLSRFDISDGPSDNNDINALGPLLMSMAAVVLIVACMNLANMLLARGTARRKEIAIRLALGAKRSRIVRQLLSEGFLLSLLGGVAGLALGIWSSDLLTSSMRKLIPLDLVWSSKPDPAILLATFAFCSLGTLAFALGPALKLSRSTVLADLKEHAGEDVTRRRWRFLPRNPLVTGQIALSLALLTAAALFIRGAGKAAAVDTGLHVDRHMLLELDASLGGLDQQRGQTLYRTLNDRLAGIPGVQHVSISATAPYGMVSLGRNIQRGGIHVGKDDKPATAEQGLAFSVRYTSIGADYFTTVGLPILRGRAFNQTEATQGGNTAVAVIDEALAKKLWPNGDALGQIIQIAPDYAPRAARDSSADMGVQNNGATTIKAEEPIEVVGITANSSSNLFEKEPRGTIYVPFGRGFQSNVYFFIQFASLNKANTANAADLVRRAVRETDPALPILSLKTFQQHLDANMGLWVVRTGATLFSAFGILALVLAVVGVYGVKAYSVARRTREIGIRMAVGAAPNAVRWMIMREGLFMLAGGIAIGLLLAIATG
ncbi:MAG: ADOP family duplicated permease, partial [Chthoniobacterales bacterium]